MTSCHEKVAAEIRQGYVLDAKAMYAINAQQHASPVLTDAINLLQCDLDPGEDVQWTALIDAANEVRERLRAMRLESFVKTPGGKGLHVVVPLTPEADWDTVKTFAQRVAEAMAKDTPGKYTATISKSARGGKIYIDYLRNGRGATAVAAYSARTRAGAPVSTPLDWSELSPAIRPSHFTVDNLPTRLRHLGSDPWAKIGLVRQSLPSAAPRKRQRSDHG